MIKKWSTNLIPFGSNLDRFAVEGYQKSLPVEERLKVVSQIEGVTGIELHCPSMVNRNNIKEIRNLLVSLGLSCSLVSPSISGDALWSKGALSNLNREIREKAINRVKEAIDLSVELGAYRINFWTGLDGYDYPFQVNYDKKWQIFLDAIKECADYNPNVKICIEYKIKEPRSKCFISDIGKLLYIIEKIDKNNVGVTLDFGHSLMAMENPAESAVLLLKEGRLFHLHFNDTLGDWDWDMIAGSIHVYEYIELFFWLRELNYQGWYSFDLYPSRENPKETITTSIKNLNKFIEIADSLEKAETLKLLEDEEAVKTLNFIQKKMFK
ncbi:MAG: sugar phosphate isomerase/epimerase [bacterium]|nr:sugar phosphate isomerase/epimerase [bacterium]